MNGKRKLRVAMGDITQLFFLQLLLLGLKNPETIGMLQLALLKLIKKQNTIFAPYSTQKIRQVVSRCGKKFPADLENATSLPAFIKN